MQKPKNLLPGLFLCVFSRIAEPLVDFYCSNLLAFPPFLFGADFFAGKKGIAGPFYTGPFCAPIPQKTPPRPQERPKQKPREPVAPLNAHLEIPTQKARRARRAFTARLYLARTAPKGSTQKPGERAAPHQKAQCKNPGSNSRGLVDEKFI